MSVSVVILAAGLGTRMKSNLAKVLHRAGGACLLEHVIRSARTIAEAGRITAVIGHQADAVRQEVSPSGVQFQVQTEQKGTGHALRVCAGLPGLDQGRVVVLYGDCPLLSPATLQRLIAAHEAGGQSATVITTNLDNPTGYGRILRDADGNVRAIVEEKAATAEEKRVSEINSGIYCFEAADLWPHLARVEPNPASGEIYLTDLVELLRASGKATVPLVIEDPSEILGINTRVELAEVDRLFRNRKVRELMLSGVTIERPETVTIDHGVEIGQDTIIGSFAQLLGSTKIASQCTIGAMSILENAQIGEGCSVFPYSSIQDSTLGAGAHVGPYARLRMGAVVEEGAHVGNFVELKKTRLGAASKSMHLAYLGDSTIGSKVNIGAGTITCNYDGQKKSPTLIGDGAFVGSNSTLVAPVEIGPGSYVAAGSVITKAVPEDALGIGRGRQENKEGWAKARREKKKG
ncbi:bifunctional UDP-N-acetylglucosamine diphosphorylase/glucosamine-1-phosphate N-acetyltransferase GlmU [Paludibaculum fermentans]|uniref:bifunctional UDP-N-acetylglucosamine diphosphorylase/glucosamine-1-phosphate N-acetyltransferase GlmU n=1 Tax=Paludibaculum fermentans TaxID=1473598 RepID=UPI003EBD2138